MCLCVCEREQPFSGGPAGAASKDPNLVSSDTITDLSWTIFLKSSESCIESCTLELTQLERKKQQRLILQPSFWCIFASARCLITVQPTSKNISVRKRGEAMLYVPLHTHQQCIPFSHQQHNLQWEVSSRTEHDLRFHLLLKCLGCRRILAELAGLHFLWTHCDVGGYVSVITSWAKGYAVYSLEYHFFFKGIPVADTNLRRSERGKWVSWKVTNSSWKFSIMLWGRGRSGLSRNTTLLANERMTVTSQKVRLETDLLGVLR